MSIYSLTSRILLIAGVVAMIVGVTEPLKGSVIIVLGTVLATVGAYLSRSKHLKPLCWSLALVVLGVLAMFDISALGLLDQEAGTPAWIVFLVLPYPVGWVIGTVQAILSLGESLHLPEEQVLA